MKVLVLAPNYPHPGHPFSGIFNEKCVYALRELCDDVEVLVPRPYVPPLFPLFSPRWKAYTAIQKREVRNGVSLVRPAIPVVPCIGGALWPDMSAFLWCRRVARKSHSLKHFDAIISFELVGAGGLAWRLGRDLAIPASGWATGGDVHYHSASSSYGRAVVRAIQRLDLVFYQSHELLEKAAGLLGIPVKEMNANRHVVLSRGIPAPPVLPRETIRTRLRAELGIADGNILVLNIGRIAREKGVFELLRALSLAIRKNRRISCVMVGSLPAFDQTATVQKELNGIAELRERVKILPACAPNKVWEYLCAADIFAFTSHDGHEGMPNSLLEAMSMGIPAIAFSIVPVREIEAQTGALVTVPPYDCELFAQAVLRLAASSDERVLIGERGRTQIMEGFMVRKNMAAALNRLAQTKATLHT